ncbi:MAG: shikimate kinase [Clostridia bacterium]|nr:shikimate kinase [Clostridia bacterium]
MRNLVLVGMMGSGKSTVGYGLGEKLNLTYFDTDAKIEAITKMSISEIFKEKGETYFRQLETNLLKEINQDQIILSTGGGMVLLEENRILLKKIGTVIYLKGSEETLYQRLISQTEKRPLLDLKSLSNQISDLLNQRNRLYETTADFTVEINGKTPSEIIDEIVGFLKE